MLSISSPIPSILVTPAPPEQNYPDSFPSAKSDVEVDGHRANWLSLPPWAASSPWHSSPLRPFDHHGPSHKGLSQDQFDWLLKVLRDQRARSGSQKVPDLRKELALKSLKQLERRARFLSKINEPAPTMVSIPKVSLEVPSAALCFVSPRRSESGHFTPGIAGDNSEDLAVVISPVNPEWDELSERDVHFAKKPPANSGFGQNKQRRIPPSLDEITARLKPAHVSSNKDCSPSRLPSFLKVSRLSSGPTHNQITMLPVRSLALNDDRFDTSFTQQVTRPPLRNPSNLPSGSRHAVTSHSAGVAAGPALHTSRADTARDMIVTLMRRSSPPPGLGRHECTHASTVLKRYSAPMELQHTGRVGFDCMAVSRGGF